MKHLAWDFHHSEWLRQPICIIMNYTSINFRHGKFNYKFQMRSWKYERGVCNTDNKDACIGNQFTVMLSWQPISSHAGVNEPFVAIKCGTEHVA